MSFEIQILTVTKEWRSIRPTGATEPYRYPTRGQARYMMRICYPDACRLVRLGSEPGVRIVESKEPPNTEYECPPAFEVGEGDY